MLKAITVKWDDTLMRFSNEPKIYVSWDELQRDFDTMYWNMYKGYKRIISGRVRFKFDPVGSPNLGILIHISDHEGHYNPEHMTIREFIKKCPINYGPLNFTGNEISENTEQRPIGY